MYKNRREIKKEKYIKIMISSLLLSILCFIASTVYGLGAIDMVDDAINQKSYMGDLKSAYLLSFLSTFLLLLSYIYFILISINLKQKRNYSQ